MCYDDSIDKKFYYEKVLAGKLNEIESRHKKFETFNDAIKEWYIRVSALEKSSLQSHLELAERIEWCGDVFCGSAACPIDVHQYRKWFFAEVSGLTRGNDDLQFLTLLFYDEMMTDKGLSEFEPVKLKNRLRKQLKRAGFKNQVIGMVEFDFHTESGLWLPHFHLIVMDDRAAVEVLRKNYKEQRHPDSSSKVSRPFHVKDVTNKARAFSYICKLYSKRIETVRDLDTGRTKKSRKFRLKSKQFRLSLCVYDRTDFSGFLFLYGVRRAGSELRINVVSKK